MPLTKDFMFKRVFTKNPEILKRFLISVLKLEINPDNATIQIDSNELIKAKDKEYHKTVDILVKINNNLKIDIEVNTEKYKTVKFRNTMYLEKIATDTIESGNTNTSMSKYYFYQLNLNTSKSDKNIGENFVLLEEESHQPLLDNFKIICKSLDYYNEVYYNCGKETTNDVIWLALISSKDFRELKERIYLVMDKKNSDKFIKDCKEASQDKLILSEWEADKMAALVKEENLELAKKDGFDNGFNNGFDDGILKTIKSMLKENLEYSLISKITNKSIEEIKKIEQTIKE